VNREEKGGKMMVEREKEKKEKEKEKK